MADSSSAFSVNFDAEAREADEGYKRVPKKFLNDMKKHRLRFVLFFVCSVISAVSFVYIPEFLGKLIDVFVSSILSSVLNGQTELTFSNLSHVIVPAIISIIIYAVFSYLCGVYSTDISSKYGDFLRKKAFDKIQTTSMIEIDTASKVKMHDLMTSEIDILNQSINIFLSQVVASAIVVIAIIVKSFTINIFIGFFILSVIPLSYVFIKLICSASQKKQGIEIPYAPEAEDIIHNMMIVHCSGKTKSVTDSVLKSEKERLKKIKRIRFYESLKQLPTLFFSGIAIVVTIYIFVCTDSVAISSISIGTILSVILYIKRIEKPLNDIMSFSQTIQNAISSSNKIYQFLEKKDEPSGKEEPQVSQEITIKVDNVSFTYSEDLKNVLDKFSAAFENHGITQIKGKTGSGKTTLLKLVLGYYQPQAGCIKLNEKDISVLNLNSYRKMFSVITQEASLFEMSIAENIAYPSKEIDYYKINSIVSSLHQENLISQLENGLDTVYRKNISSLSDGQIQIILLIRAIYNNKKFIILDESFSHIDRENETKIFDALKNLSHRIGIIFISHKDSSLGFSDNTIYLS